MSKNRKNTFRGQKIIQTLRKSSSRYRSNETNLKKNKSEQRMLGSDIQELKRLELRLRRFFSTSNHSQKCTTQPEKEGFEWIVNDKDMKIIFPMVISSKLKIPIFFQKKCGFFPLFISVIEWTQYCILKWEKDFFSNRMPGNVCQKQVVQINVEIGTNDVSKTRTAKENLHLEKCLQR